MTLRRLVPLFLALVLSASGASAAVRVEAPGLGQTAGRALPEATLPRPLSPALGIDPSAAALALTPAPPALAAAGSGPDASTPAAPEIPGPGGEAAARDYDVLVVGSGYGGSVAALRFAEDGQKVAVLEQGGRYPIGAFPAGDAALYEPENGRFGPHLIVKLSRQVRAWLGVGVGGGSLVNAAVMKRKADFPGWPGGIDAQELDPYYSKAEKMLGVVPAAPLSDPKTNFILQAGKKLKVLASTIPLAIRLRGGAAQGAAFVNEHGADQKPCTLCGECSLPGCNQGAKNSLDKNYLRLAEKHQAQIMPLRQADRIEPLAEGGWRVEFVNPMTGEKGSRTARRLVLAMGSIRSTELLLRNKLIHKTLPNLSDRLGDRYNTNGNYLGVAIARGPVDPQKGASMSAVMEHKGPDGKGQGFFVYDGSADLRSPSFWSIMGKLGGMKPWISKTLAWLVRLADGAGLFSIRRVLPLLVNGRDEALGRLTLGPDGRIKTDLDPKDNRAYYGRVDEQLSRVARAMGALLLKIVRGKIGVSHNIGGAPMGENRETGVVDDKGRVFGYADLVVLDGSILLGPLGSNPALTITAVAERAMEHLLKQLRETGRISARP